MPDDDTDILPVLHPDTVVAQAPVPACDLTPYTTPGLPPPAGLNDLGVAWGFLDPGVLRAYRYLQRLTHRPPEEVGRRAAVLAAAGRDARLLAANPGAAWAARRDTTGTPVRCYECHNIYTVLPEEPDWNVAGREDGMCFTCMTATPLVLEGTIVEKPAIEAGGQA